MHFADALAASIERTRSIVCVGLDPVLEQLPSEVRARHHEPLAAIRDFCLGIVDATLDVACCIKPQSACFERYGARGVGVLEEVCGAVRSRGGLVLLDAKRGDIGISAQHYAAAATHAGAHAITVNGYLGMETVEPYVQARLGVFVLVRTSNPGSDSIQARTLTDGQGTIAQLLAGEVARLGAAHLGEAGLSSVGAVVGATKSADATALRALMPAQFFLVPGYGAQGGTKEDVARMARAGAGSLAQAGVVVNASRSIIYATGPRDWRNNARDAARQMGEELRGALGG